MDTFDFDKCASPEPEVPAEPEAAPEAQVPQHNAPESAPYRGAGARRKESPYADSPYVMPEPEDRAYTPGYTFQPQTQPKPKAKKEKAKPGSFGRRLLALAVVAALIAAGCGITAAAVNSRWETRARSQEEALDALRAQLTELQQQLDTAGSSGPVSVVTTGDTLSPAQVYEQNVSSVVAISSSVISSSIFGESTGTSTGSGFILTRDGYIVTNHHVIANSSKVFVITNEGQEYPATVVGSDSSNDIAVLKVDAQDLPAARLGSSSELIIGDMVVAIGNPLGDLTSTQTVGYVSGKNREVTTDNTIINMIQTDAAINPGNSGGPLFNMKGEVVGITTAKYSGTTSSGASIEGIGFAIPIDDVLSMITDLMDYGYVTGAYLGVTVQNMDPASASLYGLPMGAYVIEVVEGASAHRAGIQPKDIIIAVGEHKVESITSLTRSLRNFKAGDVSTITVVRGGNTLELEITFDERPVGFDGTVPAESQPQMPNEGDYEEWYDYFFGDK